MESVIEQKVVTVEEFHGEYHNFFFVPGSHESLQRYIDDGWTVKFIKDSGTRAVVVFERARVRRAHPYGY